MRYRLPVTATERDFALEDRTVRVRTTGDPSGFPVMYFHGTPGSRLDLAFGDELIAATGVRLVSFDRPGYGGSSPSPFGLVSVARDALIIADQLGLARFATLGDSGGGPFAIATAAVGGERVTRIGVASGAGPFQEVPGAIEGLSEIDSRAVGLLPTNPAEAAATFTSSLEPILAAMNQGGDALRAAFEPLLSARDRVLFADPVVGRYQIASLREGLRQGVSGWGWDNVAYVGRWEIEVATVQTPALLWYGDEDLMAPLAHGRWLDEHLPNSRLVIRAGEGHFGLLDHLAEVLSELVAG
ncbi:MAG: alpha/beta fold hydrolase [Candidatus Dormibacteria bacterium]|jgi:pimeloyl-ACP methyl ester carboxylesterase